MSPHLNDLEIAGMRADVDDTVLDMTCNLQRETPGARDTHNQQTPGVWANTQTGIACHYWETDEEEMLGQPNATLTRERLLLPPNIDVTTKDRVMSVVGYDGTTIATSLDILEVLKRPFDTLLLVRSIQ